MSLKRCPKAWLTDEAQGEEQMVGDYHWLREHKTPVLAGGLLDQPARYVESVGIIETELAVIRRVVGE